MNTIPTPDIPEDSQIITRAQLEHEITERIKALAHAIAAMAPNIEKIPVHPGAYVEDHPFIKLCNLLVMHLTHAHLATSQQ